MINLYFKGGVPKPHLTKDVMMPHITNRGLKSHVTNAVIMFHSTNESLKHFHAYDKLKWRMLSLENIQLKYC